MNKKRKSKSIGDEAGLENRGALNGLGGSTPSSSATQTTKDTNKREGNMSVVTLLLSQSYEPVGTISWQRAVTLLTLGKVEVLEEYRDKLLRSRSWIIKMPAVVRLMYAFRRRNKHNEVKFSRFNILARDNWKCQYCEEKLTTQTVTYDHVIPRSKGGITAWENIVSACASCNGKKANRTPEEAGMPIRKKPKKPNWVPIFVVGEQRSSSLPEEWRNYLYWNGQLGG